MMSIKTNSGVDSYLLFKLNNEEFALHVNFVLNILELPKIIEIPKAPEYMKGVINLRGMVLPVIDTRIKFGLPEAVFTEKTCIIVLELNLDNHKTYVGALVDEVVAVIDLDKSQIGPPPSIGSRYRSDFIYGMAKLDENFVMLLDMEKVLNDLDIKMIKKDLVNKSLFK